MNLEEGLASRSPVTARRKRHGALATLLEVGSIYLFILPTFVLLIVFTYWPVLSALIHCFFRWDGVHNEFVGLNNFVQMFTIDRAFLISLPNVLKLAAFRLAVAMTVPFLAAEVIFGLRSARTAYFWRVLLIIPMIVPSIVLILVWIFIYDPQMGLINTILRGIGLPQLAKLWLGDMRLALWCIAFFGFPWVSGLNLLIYLAGLDSIPSELFDAAAIDGASRLRRIIRVDVPMVLGQFKLIFIMTTIAQIQGFQDVLLFTNGGPGQSTYVPGLVLYQSAFRFGKMGYASAIGVFLFVIIFILTAINMRFIRSSVEYSPEG